MTDPTSPAAWIVPVGHFRTQEAVPADGGKPQLMLTFRRPQHRLELRKWRLYPKSEESMHATSGAPDGPHPEFPAAIIGEFADLAQNPDRIGEFAQEYGDLGNARTLARVYDDKKNQWEPARGLWGEPVDDWKREAAAVARVIRREEVHLRGPEPFDCRLERLLRPSFVGEIRNGTPIRLWPRNLLGVIWYRAAWFASGQGILMTCGSCGELIAAKRNTKVFCGTACRMAEYRARRTEARQLAREGKSMDRIADFLDVDPDSVEKWVADILQPVKRKRRRK
jgi:hypothetical protein